MNEYIEYLAIDRITNNLYALVRNKNTLEQAILILDTRTLKRRTIVKKANVQPSIIIVDPMKTNLYWISHQSPSILNVANLQGQLKRQIHLLSTDTIVSYMSYDPITQDIIFVADSTVYGINTLDDHQHRLSSRILYEHTSKIKNCLFVHPILYFTNENNDNESSTMHLNSINIVAKSYAKDIAKFKNFNQLKLFLEIAPVSPIDSCKSEIFLFYLKCY